MEGKYRIARGTGDQWDTFMEEGMLVIEDALSDAEVDGYLEMIDASAQGDERYEDGKFFGLNNIVEWYPVFSELIDHPCHVGFGYDVYGELLKLHSSSFDLGIQVITSGTRTGHVQCPTACSLPNFLFRSRSHTG